MKNENKNSSTFSTANLEQIAIRKSLEKNGYKTLDSPCSIHIHSRLYRQTDADGISAKAAIDAIVRAGILIDDSPKEVKEVSFSQEKISKEEEEQTIITIEIK